MENDLKQPCSFFRFEDLRVYRKSLEYAVWLNEQICNFPDRYQTLKRQMEMHSYQIGLHIAEGSARNKGNFVFYLKSAKSSVRNCVVLSAIAKEHTLLSEEQYQTGIELMMELTKMLGALITSLQKTGAKEQNPKSQADGDSASEFDFDF